jgi:hypothetical protein
VQFNLDQATISLYPNPTKGLVYLKNIQTGYQYILSNMVGEIIQKGMINKNSEFHLENLSPGVYNLRLYKLEANNSTNQVFKIIKE